MIPVIRRSTSLSSTSSALSTTNNRGAKGLQHHREGPKTIHNQSLHATESVENQKRFEHLQDLLRSEGGDLSLDDLDNSTLNEILNGLEEINKPWIHEGTNGKNAPLTTLPKDERWDGVKRGNKQPSLDEDWKWKEPTDDENESDGDNGGGMRLKVHSSILDESVNIANLDVSFNAAVTARSRSAEKRKIAERHQKKAGFQHSKSLLLLNLWF